MAHSPYVTLKKILVLPSAPLSEPTPYTEIIALSWPQLTIKPSFVNYAYSQEPLPRLEFALLLISFGLSLISNLRQTILSTNCAGPSIALMSS